MWSSFRMTRDGGADEEGVEVGFGHAFAEGGEAIGCCVRGGSAHRSRASGRVGRSVVVGAETRLRSVSTRDVGATLAPLRASGRAERYGLAETEGYALTVTACVVA